MGIYSHPSEFNSFRFKMTFCFSLLAFKIFFSSDWMCWLALAINFISPGITSYLGMDSYGEMSKYLDQVGLWILSDCFISCCGKDTAHCGQHPSLGWALNCVSMKKASKQARIDAYISPLDFNVMWAAV